MKKPKLMLYRKQVATALHRHPRTVLKYAHRRWFGKYYQGKFLMFNWYEVRDGLRARGWVVPDMPA